MTTNKRFNFSHTDVALNLKTPIIDNDKKLSIGEVLDVLNAQHEQIDFLTDVLSNLSTYMIALGFDIELKYKDGRTINLREVAEE